jgi:hypothetical protein
MNPVQGARVGNVNGLTVSEAKEYRNQPGRCLVMLERVTAAHAL